MPNLMQRALARHDGRLRATAGASAVYIRGDFKIPLTVVLGATVFSDEEATGDSYSEVKSLDFLINPEELKLGNDLLEPRQGDQVEFDGYLFDVMSGPNGSMWRWSDGWKTFYRVHTLRRRNVSGV